MGKASPFPPPPHPCAPGGRTRLQPPPQQPRAGQGVLGAHKMQNYTLCSQEDLLSFISLGVLEAPSYFAGEEGMRLLLLTVDPKVSDLLGRLPEPFASSLSRHRFMLPRPYRESVFIAETPAEWRSPSPGGRSTPVCSVLPGGAVGLAFITHLSSSDGGNAGFSCRCFDTRGCMDVTRVLQGARFY